MAKTSSTTTDETETELAAPAPDGVTSVDLVENPAVAAAEAPAPVVDTLGAPQGEVIETWPEEVVPPRPAPPAEEAISLSTLALAQFSGSQGPNTHDGLQAHVTRLEDFLRSHAVGGSTRTTEGYYGPKTEALVRDAYAHYLPDLPEGARSGLVSPALAAALTEAGAPVVD